MPAEVKVLPNSISLASGESIDVEVTVSGAAGDSGKVFFPVKTLHGQAKGTLEVSLAGGAVFLEPDNPQKLPLIIEKIEENTTSATFRVTAQEVTLSRKERRRLK